MGLFMPKEAKMKKLMLTLTLCAIIYKGLPALINSTEVAKEIKAHNEQIALVIQ